MWEYKEEFNEDDYFGFVYKIENLTNGMFYIGKKQFQFKRKIKLKSRKTKLTRIKNSGWEEYWGSSKNLLNDIKLLGKASFKRIILFLCKTKSEQTYYENYYIYENHNLLNPLCYNEHIGHVYAKNIKSNIKELNNIIDKPKEIDDVSILNDYNNGLNLKQICSKYKISHETLNMIIPEELRGKNKMKGKKWDSSILGQIQISFNNGLSHQKIGELFNLDHGTIKYILNEKLKINTSDRDLRKNRPLGLKSKPIILKETNQIFLRGVHEAYEILKISKNIINKSLKDKITWRGYTFEYIEKDI
jgi:hypothetical protein